MPGLEDIRGRLGVAYRTLRCSPPRRLFRSFSFFFSFFSPATTHVRPSLSLSLSLSLVLLAACVCTESHDHQLSRTSGTKRAKKPVYLAGLQDRRSHAIVISRDCKKTCTYIRARARVRTYAYVKYIAKGRNGGKTEGNRGITSYLKRSSNSREEELPRGDARRRNARTIPLISGRFNAE